MESDPRAAKATGRAAPTGYSGLEALLQYVFDQEQSTNVFDSNGYILKIVAFGGDCAPYRNADTIKSDKPVSSQPGAPTGKQLYEECSAHLGPTQPGINAADPTAPASSTSSAREHSASSSSSGPQNSNAGAPSAPSAPAPSGGSGKAQAPALPIDLKRTLQQLLGHVPGLPKVPGVQLPKNVTNQVQNQVNNTPTSPQDTQSLLNYLLSP